jgi:alpha-beta hydrolase superfamily lysophospholipase
MEKHIKKDLRIQIGESRVHLNGNLTVPQGARSIIIFAHGSGSSRHSPRNRYVASVLNKRGMATLLIDLLTTAEDEIFDKRFDIDLLAERLEAVTEYIKINEELTELHIGYFGASTGAAAALRAASHLSGLVEAVVSRGGRPDLAGGRLPMVKAPTLLIVGSLDTDVIELNRDAYKSLKCEKRMIIIEGASHLFEEEGKLEEVSQFAIEWFEAHLAVPEGNKVHVL